MSIPTSVILVLLVAAWLAVLVPMVARRREAVPEAEVDGGTFRVLRRASRSVRRRPGPRRGHDVEDDINEQVDGAEFADGELDDATAQDDHRHLRSGGRYADEEPDDSTDVDEYDDETDEYAAHGYRSQESDADGDQDADHPQAVEPGAEPGRGRFRRWGRGRSAVDDDAQPAHTGSHPYRPAAESEDEPAVARLRSGGSSPYVPDAEPTYSRPAGRAALRADRLAGVDESALRPIPRRPGRGGYDPDAAEAARAYRYSRRRRIAVTLLLAAVLCTAAALLVNPIAWVGTAFFGLLLIGYLAYLRRQVQIEADIRERRLARLRRARQIRPEYELDLDRSAGPVTGSDFARAAVPVSQVPPTGYRRGREIVDLEDDDPSFDDLEYYQPLSYRRASGQ